MSVSFAKINPTPLMKENKNNNSTPHPHCSKCQYVPPYITQKIMEATAEQYQDHQDLISTHFRNRHAFRAYHKQEQALFGRHKKVQITDAEARAHKLVSIYDVKGKERISGKLAPEDSIDPVAIRARQGLVGTYMYYHDVHKRDSLDGKGMPFSGYIHYGLNYENAYWDGDGHMVFGGGDGKVFDDFTKDLDVIGHELTHAVTQYTANLVYERQPGALNESMSDVFGILFKQRVKNQTVEESNWLIGEDVVIGPDALRSMRHGKAYSNHSVLGDDPQPESMDEYVELSLNNDEGGVHLYSKIPNMAFHSVSMALGGYAWDKAGQIWYHTLTHSLKPTSNFEDFANATIKSAKKLYKDDPSVEKAVITAWREVKVLK